MHDFDPGRRQVIRFLISLPIGLSIGCSSDEKQTQLQVARLSPEASLKKLLLLIGPWSPSERREADDFARRFLASEHTVSPHIASAETVQDLAARFPDEAMGMRELDLGYLSEEEREILLVLVKQLYSSVEVRFMLSGQPPEGQCQGDATIHIRPIA